MCQPKVSVVVPVYNVEKYIDRCVESIVNQTYDNLEIILVDDGSSDNSPALCDMWAKKDSRIKAVHKVNAGAGMARNTGMDNATGNYILFVDSDDYIDLSTVEKCVSTAQNHGSDIVMYGRFNVKPNGQKEKSPVLTDKYFFQKKEVTEDILPGLFINEKGLGVGVCGKMMKLDIIKKSGVRLRSEREVLSEDAFFLIELFAHVSSVSILAENLYYYFQNENSFSRTYKKDHQAMNDNFLKCCTQACERLGYSEKVLQHVQARYQIYALTGMKQIIASDLSLPQKHDALKLVFNNRLLKSTVTTETLNLAKRQSRIFWRFFKLRFYFLCCLMLWFKARK